MQACARDIRRLSMRMNNRLHACIQLLRAWTASASPRQAPLKQPGFFVVIHKLAQPVIVRMVFIGFPFQKCRTGFLVYALLDVETPRIHPSPTAPTGFLNLARCPGAHVVEECVCFITGAHAATFGASMVSRRSNVATSSPPAQATAFAMADLRPSSPTWLPMSACAPKRHPGPLRVLLVDFPRLRCVLAAQRLAHADNVSRWLVGFARAAGGTGPQTAAGWAEILGSQTTVFPAPSPPWQRQTVARPSPTHRGH